MGIFLAPLVAAAMAPTAIALGRKMGMRDSDQSLYSNTDFEKYRFDDDGYNSVDIMKNFAKKDPLSNLSKIITPDRVAQDEIRERNAQFASQQLADTKRESNLSDVAHAMYEEDNYVPSIPLRNSSKTITNTHGTGGTGGGGSIVKEEENSLSPLTALAGLAALYGGYRMMRR